MHSAGPQIVLTADPKALKKKDEYTKFVEELNSLTFQQISTAPRGVELVLDSILHGAIGTKKRQENIKKQQLIYGVTKFYYEDLREFMSEYGK